ncbi:MAG: metallophosphoesterase [Myxococcales bacterium]|nr:metallophosphoesterase [Myxococcales bacterium]
MPPHIVDPEVFGVTETTLTLTFRLTDQDAPSPDAARILVDGEERAVSEGATGTRQIRLTDLEPGTSYRIEIEAPGAEAPERNPWFPEVVETMSSPGAEPVATFATLNDLHFGEPRFGGTFVDGDAGGPDTPEMPSVREGDTDVPYWRFMNEDAVADINASGVDATFIKGDIADRGRPEQFEAARDCFSGFTAPHHAFLGNHDHYAKNEGLEVDGYALLDQPAAPRTVDLANWRLVLLETALPGEHHGEFDDSRLRWLEQTLEEADAAAKPTLLLMHHHPVPPEFIDRYPNSIGIRPEHSLAMFDLVGRFPSVRGVLIGHTHRNRLRRYERSGSVPWIEVNCTKDYPGGWGHYRLYEDGSFRQEVRRTSSERALSHSTKCSGFFNGGYRMFSLGSLEQRSFTIPAP